MNKSNQSHKYPITERWGDALNSALLGIHIIYFIIFLIMGIKVMMYFNIFSMALYVMAYGGYAKRPLLSISATFIEILIHYMVAVQCIGWGAGFQDYCFATIVVCFYVGYAFEKDKIKGYHPIPVAIISALCFYVCWIESRYGEPLYFVAPKELDRLMLMNDTFVMLILGFFTYVFLTRILSERRRLSRNAKYDELTRLPNRHYIDGVRRDKNLDDPEHAPSYAIAIIDIDDFKKVNDTYGHNTGDDVLAELGSLLLKLKDEYTITSRWGGEEFLIIRFGSSPGVALMDICEGIRKSVGAKTMVFKGFTLRVTISVGVCARSGDETFEDTFKKADNNLYEAKATGKNKVVYK